MLCEQQIIDAIKTRLLNGTDADNRVYSDRLWPIDEGKLPALRVYAMEDKVAPQTVHYPVLEKHELDVAIELCALATSGIDATINALKAEVLARLFDTLPHATLALKNVQLVQGGTGPLQPIETATKQLAQRTLKVTAHFSAYAHQPETFV